MLGRSTRPGSRRGAAVVSAPEPRPQSGSALRGSPASDCAPSGSACLTALCPPHCRCVRMRTAGLAPAPEDSNRRPPCETQTSIQLVLKTGALKNEGKDRSFYTKRTFLRFQAAPTCPPPPDSVPRHVVGAGGTLSLSHPGACTPEEPRCCRQRGAFRPPGPCPRHACGVPCRDIKGASTGAQNTHLFIRTIVFPCSPSNFCVTFSTS